MISSIEKYKTDLDKLIDQGDQLFNAIQYECYPEKVREQLKALIKDQAKMDALIKEIPSFKQEYQNWYSEAQVLIKQLLPNRYADFVSLYEKPKTRKEVQFGNYIIADYMQGLRITSSFSGEEKVGPSAAIPQFQQQLNILKSITSRFESSLFDIKQLVQADLFDSELDAARELLRSKFERAASAIAGVVLERHLQQVCENHNIKLAKKDPAIGDLNDALKNSSIIETPQWRSIQHLGDLRNLCDHNKKKDPTSEQVSDLIEGVEKVTKTLF